MRQLDLKDRYKIEVSLRNELLPEKMQLNPDAKKFLMSQNFPTSQHLHLWQTKSISENAAAVLYYLAMSHLK